MNEVMLNGMIHTNLLKSTLNTWLLKHFTEIKCLIGLNFESMNFDFTCNLLLFASHQYFDIETKLIYYEIIGSK